ncbi:Gfo/Idh/MocA family protein [Cyclobacterium plantarum]|uniref:Gfo/Idh/MocA family oxidoreductase n=1 Tax=Cyclobacterium plantarum TaxID=2716263 RepID=A0ABX0H767_9BACT|nr:Gfo/Idh/MocA family oxidoreductase [Cyclobacterium plantarum]NHE57280.1 Gfo/Idh/MocA family oxidoreductase [Cyclobacterium plantarum]
MKKEKQSNLSRRNFMKSSTKGALAASLAVTGFPTIVPASVFGKNAPSNKINIGQVGFGRIAMTHDLPETMKNDIARVIAVADVDRDRAGQGKNWIEKYYADKTGNNNYVDVKVFEDYKEMINHKDVDAVIISTPDHWHAQPAMEAALAGKDIYLQKPTSLTIEEGRMMSDTIHRTGAIFQIGSQQRSMNPWPQFKRACELVRNGRIGKIERILVGLPGDPAGGNPVEMPVPANLNYDMWLGSTPWVPYTLDRVHSQSDIRSRPGWLRCEQFGAGMITGWGAHHLDIAHWGMGKEYSGPVELEATASFPTEGLWTVHGDFKVTAKYDNDVIMEVSGDYPNGVRFEGTEGWIFVARGNVGVTDSDPVPGGKASEAFKASDQKILTSEIGPEEIHLYASEEQHKNWLDCIVSREQTIAPVEVAHRSCSACLLSHIAMKLPRKLYWDPVREKFKNDDEANAMLSRPNRHPYGTQYVL